ncbi:MAG: hypothetical protein ITG02_07105 [Patulibacter sp.]|nr:hypothetical protein [Patulibacter sp.]
MKNPHSRIAAAVGTAAPPIGVSVIGTAFEQPFLSIVGGVLLVVFALLVVVAFFTFLPIFAAREAIENEVRRQSLEQPPD